jgi:hypothetical protein
MGDVPGCGLDDQGSFCGKLGDEGKSCGSRGEPGNANQALPWRGVHVDGIFKIVFTTEAQRAQRK